MKYNKLLRAGVVFGLLSCNAMLAQTHNTGINKDNANATLDVGGGVRLKTPGEPIEGAVLLGINESNNQIVKSGYALGAPFTVGRHIVPVTPRTQGELVKNYDLNIEADAYVAAIGSINLMRGTQEQVSNYTAQAATMSIQSVSETIIGDHGPYENRVVDVVVSTSGGWLTSIVEDNPELEGNSHWLQGNLNARSGVSSPPENLKNFLFYPVPKTYLSVKNGKYAFTGFYQDSEDLDRGVNKFWDIEVFSVNRNWIQEEKVINATVTNNNNGATMAITKTK